MNITNVHNFALAAENDVRKASVFAEAFHDFIDGTMYPGYSIEIAEENPDLYAFEFSQFLKNYGDDDTGEVLEPIQA